MAPQVPSKPYPKTHLLAILGVLIALGGILTLWPDEPDSLADTQSLEGATIADNADAQAIDAAVPEDPAVPGAREMDIKVKKGHTLGGLLAQTGIPPEEIADLLKLKALKPLHSLRPGQVLSIKLTEDGQLDTLSTEINDLETLTVSREDIDSPFEVQHEVAKPEISHRHISGTINGALFAATRKAGLSHRLSTDLANIFAYDIDFALDLRAGDQFEVIYEEKRANDKVIGEGAILAARFVNRGKVMTALRYTRNGSSSYYTPEGNSLRKAFIRTPVDFARISSGFNLGRLHPILNTIRAHKGVDYAAPTGTPVKAAGDGVVLLAGRKGGYGNTLMIKHGQRYTTLYGHLNGFAKGIRSGSRVRQGQLVGYVGTTGMSTGPHLHYEFQVNGVHVNPLKQKKLMADPINGRDKLRFRETTRALLARLNKDDGHLVAMNGKP